jgi:hypothetical protein
MNPQSVDIKDMLVADSTVALTFKTDLFIGKEPSTPKNCVTIFDTSGFPPNLTMDGKDTSNYEYVAVQIRVRNTSYTNGWALIHNIMESLHGRAQETWSSTLYSVIYCSSGPALLDWDDSGNARFVANFEIQRRG